VPPPFPGTRAVGINGGANVEYCIIENQVNMPSSGVGAGGAILNSSGTIQNNIIRNNHAEGGSAFYGCSGLISNNVIYNNTSVAIGACSGKIYNNTLYNNISGFAQCEGEIANNIFWWDDSNEHISIGGSSSIPNYCLIKGYTGPGNGNIDADPKFVDPENFDFRLQTDSPAIDAGGTSPTLEVKADFNGVQRGLKSKAVTGGDGSGVDIGAHEFIPKPVAVWLPNGGPDDILTGDTIDVAWQMEVETAGTTVGLQLFRDGTPLTDFGPFDSATSTGLTQVVLTDATVTNDAYFIRGTSALNLSLTGATAYFTVTGPNATVHWFDYR
jgi:hypothetical protein